MADMKYLYKFFTGFVSLIVGKVFISYWHGGVDITGVISLPRGVSG